jgi:protein subunit release factor B
MPVPEGYTLPEDDVALLAQCDVDVFRATGPGGQGVNTTDSAVRLTHRLTGIVVVCRRQRSQLRNKEECLDRLRKRILEAMAPPPPPRRATRPGAAAEQRRLTGKSVRAAVKRTRQAPRRDED